MSKIKKKLSSGKGETILETLVALLIIALSVAFLSATIAKSTGILNEVKKMTEDGFAYDGESIGKKAIADDKSIMSSVRTVTVYEVPQYKSEEENVPNYYYYEP